jgi:hypothetical protein
MEIPQMQQFQKLLQNKETLTMIIILIIGVSFLQILDIKIILTLTLAVLIYINYDKLLTINKPSIPNVTNKPSDNKLTKKMLKKINEYEITPDMYYNDITDKYLEELKKFKKYNKPTYKEGVKHLKSFFKLVHILEKNEINNYNQYFDSAMMYLKKSVNTFQSITISLPERDLIHAIKYNDYEATKKSNKLGNICKELYKEGYYILLNLSQKLNQKWVSNPNIYNKEISLNYDHVEEDDKSNDIHWSLY